MVVVHGPSDPDLEAFIPGFEAYIADHPRAKVEMYRVSRWSLRARVVDPDFRGRDRVERHETVRSYLRALSLPDEVYCQLIALPQVTPAEVHKTGSSLEFDDLKPQPPAPVPAPAAARTKKRGK